MPQEQLQMSKSDPQPGIKLITLEGPLTISTMFNLQSDLRNATDSVVIDMTGVPYMDSAGLGCLLGGMTSCQRNKRAFGLAGVSERLLTVFTISGIEGLVPMYPDQAAALSAVAAKATAAK